MGWGSKKKWESLPADEVADSISRLPAKEAAAAMKQIKEGKVPGLTPRELKQIEKDFKKKTEGERGLGALGAGINDLRNGRGTTTKKFDPKRHVPLNRDGSPRKSWR